MKAIGPMARAKHLTATRERNFSYRISPPDLAFYTLGRLLVGDSGSRF
jgi:hypothetical protein